MKKLSVLLCVPLLLTMTACGGDAAPAPTAQTEVPTEAAAVPVTMNMQELYDTVTAMENIPEMLPLDADMQLSFCGIAAEDCAQAVVAICSDGLRTDEFWMIEAVDAAALERIQQLAENRLTAKGEESITYSPEQYAVVQKAEIIVCDNYFILLVSPEVTALAEYVRSTAGI